MSSAPIRPQGVNIALMRQHQKHWQILMVQRAATEIYPLAWGLITGTRQDDETLAETAFRELREELSVEPKILWSTNHLVTFYEPQKDCIWHAPVFVLIIENEQISPNGEISEVTWCSCDDGVARSRWKSLKQILPELFDEIARFPDETWQRLDAPA